MRPANQGAEQAEIDETPKKHPTVCRERDIELEAREQLQRGWPCEAEKRIAHADGVSSGLGRAARGRGGSRGRMERARAARRGPARTGDEERACENEGNLRVTPPAGGGDVTMSTVVTVKGQK